MNKEIETENNFRKSGTINSCKLTRKDFLELSDNINDIFVNEEYTIKIRSRHEHFEYEAKDFISFIEIRKIANVLNNLEINIFGNNKFVTLNLGIINNYLSVSGSDEAWVLGAYQKIENFIYKKRPWYYSRLTVFFILSGMILFILGIQIIKNNYYALILIFFIILFYYYVYVTGILDKIFPDFQLRISKPDTIITKDNIVIFVKILTLLAIIIGTIVSVIQFLK
jgi:hypothetical protein